MERSELVKLVKSELKNLRKNATQEELIKLGKNRINPDNRYMCIYGQMTGDCCSDRAIELIRNCCVKLTSILNMITAHGINDPMSMKRLDTVNLDSMTPRSWEKDDFIERRDYNYLSPMETYIFLNDAKKKEIIDYLKTGNKESLDNIN